MIGHHGVCILPGSLEYGKRVLVDMGEEVFAYVLMNRGVENIFVVATCLYFIMWSHRSNRGDLLNRCHFSAKVVC